MLLTTTACLWTAAVLVASVWPDIVFEARADDWTTWTILAMTWLLAALLALSFLTLLAQSAHCVWQMWLRWSVGARRVDASVSNVPHALTNLHFDPQYGLVGDVADGARRIRVVLNPSFWHLLPPSALARGDGAMESVCEQSPVQEVTHSKGPPSLVSITNGQRVLGMGARVRHNGSTYLMTASHVWNGSAPALYLRKNHVEIEVSKDLPIVAGSKDLRVDVVLVKVDDKVWSALQVKAAALKCLESRTPVTCYGDVGDALLASSGMATKGFYVHQIVHGSTTAQGWSGTPLYSGDSIVGTHLAVNETGKSNRAVNTAVLLQIAHETAYSEYTLSEISMEQVEDRDYEFLDVDLEGRGRVLLGNGEYHIPIAKDPYLGRQLGIDPYSRESVREQGFRMPLWSSMLETAPGNLNCQRAGAEKRSPPSSLMGTTNGEVQSVSAVLESSLAKLALQVSDLEKELGKQREGQSSRQSPNSPNSQISPGQTEAPTPSEDHSSSKPAGSKRPRRRRASKKPAIDSARDIPGVSADLVSRMSGAQILSLRKLLDSAIQT